MPRTGTVSARATTWRVGVTEGRYCCAGPPRTEGLRRRDAGLPVAAGLRDPPPLLRFAKGRVLSCVDFGGGDLAVSGSGVRSPQLHHSDTRGYVAGVCRPRAPAINSRDQPRSPGGPAGSQAGRKITVSVLCQNRRARRGLSVTSHVREASETLGFTPIGADGDRWSRPGRPTQNLVGASPWGFDSPSRHQSSRSLAGLPLVRHWLCPRELIDILLTREGDDGPSVMTLCARRVSELLHAFREVRFRDDGITAVHALGLVPRQLRGHGP